MACITQKWMDESLNNILSCPFLKSGIKIKPRGIFESVNSVN